WPIVFSRTYADETASPMRETSMPATHDGPLLRGAPARVPTDGGRRPSDGRPAGLRCRMAACPGALPPGTSLLRRVPEGRADRGRDRGRPCRPAPGRPGEVLGRAQLAAAL